MSNKPDISEFVRKLDAILNVYKKIPTEIATIAVNFSKERFRRQGWLDRSEDKWKPLARKRGSRNSKKSQTILVKSGRLKRSIRKIKVTPDQIIIGTDVPYAEIHNEGGIINETVTVRSHIVSTHSRKAHTRMRKGVVERIKRQTVKEHTVKSHKRKMNLRIPSRRFLGNSQTLNNQITDHIVKRFTQALEK